MIAVTQWTWQNVDLVVLDVVVALFILRSLTR